MLPGEHSLPEAIFASDSQVVNRLFAALSRAADQYLGCGSKNSCKSCSLPGLTCIGRTCAVPLVRARP